MNTEERRIERIRRYEDYYQQLKNAVAKLDQDYENFTELQTKAKELEMYYSDGSWMQDYAADEAGELPPDLKRGVLSQDGLYDLLSENDRWLNAQKEEVS